MYTVLSITLPFFAIIFFGTFFHASKIFDNNSSKILTKYALYVTLPPFMFINIIKASNEVIFNFNFIIRFEIVTIFLLASTFLISLFIIKNNKKDSSLFALNSSYPNYGYMGIPLCILAFGEMAAVPISLILLIDTIILLSFTTFFIDYDQKKSFLKEIYNLFFSMLKNPILVAAIVGFLFVLLKLQLPLIIFNFLEIISFAATPTALFAIGISIFKLICHPFLVFFVFFFYSDNISPLWIKVAILCSSLPVAGNVFAMSIFYNSYTKKTSGSILITTVLSTFSVPIILFLLIN
jgi:hypothetical protein